MRYDVGMNRKARRAAERKGAILVPVKPETVTFANINPGEVTAELFGSFTHLMAEDMQTTHYIDNFICKSSGGLLSIFRNGVVAEFLQECESDWLWLVDSDICLESNTLHLLMEASKAHPEAHIVSGWYVLPMEDGRWASTFHWNGDNFSYTPVPESIQYVDSVGLGCVMIRRKLLVAMKDKYGLPSPWFTITERKEDKERGITPRVFGEDHSFFLRTLFDFNQRVLLVPEAQVGHKKSTVLTGADIATANGDQ